MKVVNEWININDVQSIPLKCAVVNSKMLE